jgi:hypothetical protein
MIAAGIAAAVIATVFTAGASLKANFYDKLGAMFD